MSRVVTQSPVVLRGFPDCSTQSEQDSASRWVPELLCIFRSIVQPHVFNKGQEVFFFLFVCFFYVCVCAPFFFMPLHHLRNSWPTHVRVFQIYFA